MTTSPTQRATHEWRCKAQSTAVFGDLWRISGKTFGLFDAASVARGPLHVHDGLAGLLVWSHGAVDSSTAVIVPNGSGDVVYRLIFFCVVENGGTTAANWATLAVGGTHDVAVGSGTSCVPCGHRRPVRRLSQRR